MQKTSRFNWIRWEVLWTWSFSVPVFILSLSLHLLVKYLENPQQLIEYRNKLESSLNTIYTKNSELRSELYKSETKLHEYKQNLQKSEETISQLKQDLARKNYVYFFFLLT